MDITIEQMPNGKYQAYGEDLEAARAVMTCRTAEEIGDGIAEFLNEHCPSEEYWEPGTEPTAGHVWAEMQRRLHEQMAAQVTGVPLEKWTGF